MKFCAIIWKEVRKAGKPALISYFVSGEVKEMGQRLSGQNLIFVGFTLFSMFFGAGNLIFPPFLGAESGTLT